MEAVGAPGGCGQVVKKDVEDSSSPCLQILKEEAESQLEGETWGARLLVEGSD